ncbi:MAG: hypothetical protein U0637_13915 [Phycisphaerales bacterium]
MRRLGWLAWAAPVACCGTVSSAQVRVVQLDAVGDPPAQPYVRGAFVTHIAGDRSFAAGWSTLQGDGGPMPLMWDLSTGAMVFPPSIMAWPTGLSGDGRVLTTTEDWLYASGSLRWDRGSGGMVWFPAVRCSESADGSRRAEAVLIGPGVVETRAYEVPGGALVASVPGAGDIGASGGVVLTDTHVWFEGIGVTDLRPQWPSGAWLSRFQRFMSADGSVFGGRLEAPAATGYLWRHGVGTVTPGVIPVASSQYGSVILTFHEVDPGNAWGSVLATRIRSPRHGEQSVAEFLAAEAPAFHPPGGARFARAVSPDGRGLVVFVAFDAASGGGNDFYYVELNGDHLCGDIDFNNDGLFPDTGDIDTLLCSIGGDCCWCPPAYDCCDSIDFNHDGLFPDTADIDAFLRVFSGGPCL